MPVQHDKLYLSESSSHLGTDQYIIAVERLGYRRCMCTGWRNNSSNHPAP